MVGQVTRDHGVPGDRVPIGHGIENLKRGFQAAIAHVGGDGHVHLDYTRFRDTTER